MTKVMQHNSWGMIKSELMKNLNYELPGKILSLQLSKHILRKPLPWAYVNQVLWASSVGNSTPSHLSSEILAGHRLFPSILSNLLPILQGECGNIMQSIKIQEDIFILWQVISLSWWDLLYLRSSSESNKFSFQGKLNITSQRSQLYYG